MPATPATPFLALDEDTLHRNLDRLADYARRHNLGLRPHTKTHKSLHLADLQLQSGAIGLTVAKTGEAEVMAQTGASILVAYPVVAPAACVRLAEIEHASEIIVAVDSETGASALSEAARNAGRSLTVIIDLDVGMHRTGVATPQAVLELAQIADAMPGLNVGGLMFYPGHIWSQGQEQELRLAEVSAAVEQAVGLFTRSGLSTRIVSGGSTPTAFSAHHIPSSTEIRPGTYIFNDLNTVRAGACALEDCAATIRCTVVSTAVPGQFVIDAGTKTLTSDLCLPDRDSGHGLVLEYPDAKITRLSEEHGQVQIGPSGQSPRVGDTVTVVPNHICPCVNLQNNIWLADSNGGYTALPVDARGRVF